MDVRALAEIVGFAADNGLIPDETERERLALLQAAATILAAKTAEAPLGLMTTEEIKRYYDFALDSAHALLAEIKRREPKDEAPDVG